MIGNVLPPFKKIKLQVEEEFKEISPKR